MCHKLLQDARLYSLLLMFDEDLAAEGRRGGCPTCGGRLDSGAYRRKPRGGPTLPAGYEWRHSFCCAVRDCRKRQTPPSVRFLGRRVYLGAVVVLATAMQQGVTRWRASQLRALLGVSSQTLARWRLWWSEAFVESAFWKVAKAVLSPPADESRLPHALLVRFAGDEVERLAGLLRFLSPLSTSAGYVADRRR